MPSYTRKVKVPGKSPQELYDAISSDIDHFLSKSSFGTPTVNRKPERREIELKISIKAASISANLVCLDEMIEVDAQLSLLAAPFKSKIDDGINHWLKKKFNLGS